MMMFLCCEIEIGEAQVHWSSDGDEGNEELHRGSQADLSQGGEKEEKYTIPTPSLLWSLGVMFHAYP